MLKKESAPATKDEEPRPKKVKKVYTIRDVIKQRYQTLVNEEIPFQSNEPGYLGNYQKAVTAVLNKMSEEDLEEAEKLVELWNKKGGPSDLQLK
jgi:transposase